MKGFWREYCSKNLWFKVLSGFAILLLIASFIVPPMGVIDSSVLIATSEIFAFAALGTVVKAIDEGKTAKIRKGDTELSVGDNE